MAHTSDSNVCFREISEICVTPSIGPGFSRLSRDLREKFQVNLMFFRSLIRISAINREDTFVRFEKIQVNLMFICSFIRIFMRHEDTLTRCK